MVNRANILIMLALWLFCAPMSNAATTSSITQQGITFNFDAAYEYGQFANGDYWVVGPLTINSMTPAYDGSNNGWIVNPSTLGSEQWFDSELDGFTPASIPSLPYYVDTSTGIKSVIKADSGTDGRDLPLDTVVILTVVPTAPLDNGVNTFRPAYFGTDKTYYYTTDINTSLILSLAPAASGPTIETLTTRYAYTRYMHFVAYGSGAQHRYLHPLNAVSWATTDGYVPDFSHHDMAAYLMMMCNTYTYSEKKPVLIKLLQIGIDTCGAALAGWRPPAAGGHQPGHRLHTAFAATILNIASFKANLEAAASGMWHEDMYLQTSDYISGSYGGLYGEVVSEAAYWNYVMTGSGGRSTKDPYGYIDGGKTWDTYMLIVTPTWGYEALLTRLIPGLVDAWPDSHYTKFNGYATRVMDYGAWAQPDPCAPYTAGGTYGVDYGPDPDDTPAPCILDTDLSYYNSPTDFACTVGQSCGRVPEKHFATKGLDLVSYSNAFADGMWVLYHDYSASDTADPTITACDMPSTTTSTVAVVTGTASDNVGVTSVT